MQDRSLNCLIIGLDQETNDALCQLLSQSRCTVTQVTTITDALDLDTRLKFDIAFMVCEETWRLAELKRIRRSLPETYLVCIGQLVYLQEIRPFIGEEFDQYMFIPVADAEVRHIIAQRENVAAIKRSHRIIQDRFNHLHHSDERALIRIDKNGKIVDANIYATRMLGYEKTELLGEPVTRLYRGDIKEARRVRHALVLDNGYIQDFTTAVMTKSGNSLPIVLTAWFQQDGPSYRSSGSIGLFRTRDSLHHEVRTLLQDVFLPDSTQSSYAKLLSIVAARLSAENVLMFRYENNGQLKCDAATGHLMGMLSGIDFSHEPIFAATIENQSPMRAIAPLFAQSSSLGIESLTSATHAFLCTPLAYRTPKGEQPFGLIVAINKYWPTTQEIDPSGFSWSDEAWLSALASELTFSIQTEYYQGALSALMRIGSELGKQKVPSNDSPNELSIINEILATMVNVLGYSTAYIRLRRPDNSLPVWRAYGSHTDQLVPHTLNKGEPDPYSTPAGLGVVGRTVKFNELQTSRDVLEDPIYHFKENARQAGWRGMISIPLQLGEQVIGVLVSYTNRPHEFTESDKAWVVNLANLATLALSGAILAEDHDQWRQTMQSIMQAIGEKHPPDKNKKTWAIMLYHFMTLTKAERGSVHQVNVDEQMLVPLVQRGFSPAYERTNHAIGPSSIVGWVADNQMPVRIEDIDLEQEAWGGIYYEGANDTKSELAVPIISSDSQQLIGIINLESPRQKAFTVEHLRLLESLSAFAGAVERDGNLRRQLDKRKRSLDAFKWAFGFIAKMKLTGLRRQDVLQVVLQQAINVTGAAIGAIHLRDDTNPNILRLAVAYPVEHKEVVADRATVLTLEGQGSESGIAARAVKFNVSQRIADVRNDIDYREVYPLSRSEIAIPIRDENDAIGVLNLEHPQVAKFDEEDQANLEELCQLISVALEVSAQAGKLARDEQKANTKLILPRFLSLMAEKIVHDATSDLPTAIGSLQNLRRRQKTQGLESRELDSAIDSLQHIIKKIRDVLSYEPTHHCIITHIPAEYQSSWKAEHRVHLDVVNRIMREYQVQIDELWLLAAIDLLLDNARKASLQLDENARVRIVFAADDEEERIMITINDNGPGIPAELREMLGEERIKDSRGSGLGCHLALSLIEAADGQIRWTNGGDLGGANVEIQLPIARVA